MIRTLLVRILPFLVPIILFAVWYFLARRRAGKAGEKAPSWREAPWGWIALSGLLVLALGLAFFRFSTGASPDGTYVPPKYEDGRVIPGHVEP